ncbi:hypothetical protein BDV33DRAFT_210467 [Aspergillus novoparasiticus]|uniref:Uncharacterized protein n=1 Tax=Aspergillus novoparasiticus TaxID=986946 RepID=A0A5N6E9R4_9EURO|nr:hypothetical protein BDV33DRAFT_210467 [Aspergillus novoparasiticus]
MKALMAAEALESIEDMQGEIEYLTHSKQLHDYAETLTGMLNYNGLLKLALLTWHFDASFYGTEAPPLSRELLIFFSPTYDREQVYEELWKRTIQLQLGEATFEIFKARFTRQINFFRRAFLAFWTSPSK